jgi:hypothetical protein
LLPGGERVPMVLMELAGLLTTVEPSIYFAVSAYR